MYHALMLDHIRLEQAAIQRRAEQAAQWGRLDRPARPRRGWWPRPRRSALRLAMSPRGC